MYVYPTAKKMSSIENFPMYQRESQIFFSNNTFSGFLCEYTYLLTWDNSDGCMIKVPSFLDSKIWIILLGENDGATYVSWLGLHPVIQQHYGMIAMKPKYFMSLL